MTSSKDTFEANTFAANSFAAGCWRGTGMALIVPTVPGGEAEVLASRRFAEVKATHHAEVLPSQRYAEVPFIPHHAEVLPSRRVAEVKET